MAFASYLGDFDVDAETNRVLHAALEMTRAALGLADDFANGIIARQIVELCQGRLAASRRFVRRRIEEITRAFVRGLTGAPSKRPPLRRSPSNWPAFLCSDGRPAFCGVQ